MRQEWMIRIGALIAIVVVWLRFGWQAALLLFSFGAFLLMLQFSRTLRALRDASGSPVGHVGSAVMLNSKLRKGMRLSAILGLTGSLGTAVKLADETVKGPVVESFRWRDAGAVSVDVELVDGRVERWSLERPPEVDGADDAAVATGHPRITDPPS